MTKVSSLLYAPVALLFCLSPLTAKLQPKPAEHDKAWIAQSDKYTKMLIDLDKKYSPEYGSSQGLAEYDNEISTPTLANDLAERKDEEALLKIYAAATKTEKNAAVVQDLNILIKHLQLGFRQQDFSLKRRVPFYNAANAIYDGLEILLDDQTDSVRRPSAIVRMRKYAGLEKGYKPLATILQERTAHQIAGKDMIYPSKQKMEIELSRNASVMAGIPELCKKFNLKGWEQPYAELKKQVEAYDQWVRDNVLVKARTDYRLPPEEYALGLEGYGIDISPADLAKQAHAAFTDIQGQMKEIAAQIAKQRNLPSADYRDVVRELKKQQVVGDSIMPLYARTLKSIEGIIRDHQLVTLPTRPAIIRLATEAETAQSPAPHMVPPPFLNNTGQRGVFVLPLNMPVKPAKKKTDTTISPSRPPHGHWWHTRHARATSYSLTRWLRKVFQQRVRYTPLTPPMQKDGVCIRNILPARICL
jgi:hypothetical protein